MSKPVSDEEYERLAAFRYALRRFFRFSEESAQAAGLTPQQHQALLAVRGFPGNAGRVSISDLAERLQIRHHSAVGLVNRLVAQGFVIREPAETDRRQVYISLTPHGREVLEQLTAAHREELRRLGPQLHLLLDHLTAEQERSSSEATSSL